MYAFTLQTKKSRFIPIAVIVMALAICLFPIWPYHAKLVIFYVSFYALIVIIGFAIVRFIIYYLVRLFGYEFWILPEIFENVR